MCGVREELPAAQGQLAPVQPGEAPGEAKSTPGLPKPWRESEEKLPPQMPLCSVTASVQASDVAAVSGARPGRFSEEFVSADVYKRVWGVCEAFRNPDFRRSPTEARILIRHGSTRAARICPLRFGPAPSRLIVDRRKRQNWNLRRGRCRFPKKLKQSSSRNSHSRRLLDLLRHHWSGCTAT